MGGPKSQVAFKRHGTTLGLSTLYSISSSKPLLCSIVLCSPYPCNAESTFFETNLRITPQGLGNRRWSSYY